MQRRGKREILGETRRPVASSGTIPVCESHRRVDRFNRPRHETNKGVRTASLLPSFSSAAVVHCSSPSAACRRPDVTDDSRRTRRRHGKSRACVPIDSIVRPPLKSLQLSGRPRRCEARITNCETPGGERIFWTAMPQARMGFSETRLCVERKTMAEEVTCLSKRSLMDARRHELGRL
ncbi:hypothetical protein PR048_024602 [Dryococelus australis]|uniref:Uncharacterized protein n=1 Tax=Dryococelus australis TaxID=614101 RepID=A0ABQ9GP03_9NEOP|nr:hypothetical protein PR048_024602 [Dryococelus australis]